MANAMPRGARLLIQHQWRRRRQRQQFAGIVVGSIIFPSHSHDNRITMMLLILQHHPAHRLEKAIHPIMEMAKTGILIHHRRRRHNLCIVNNHLLNVTISMSKKTAAIPLSMRRILMTTTISVWALRKKTIHLDTMDGKVFRKGDYYKNSQPNLDKCLKRLELCQITSYFK